MKNEFDRVLCEIEEIIARIGNYKLSENERMGLIKLFRAKIRQAKYIHGRANFKLVG